MVSTTSFLLAGLTAVAAGFIGGGAPIAVRQTSCVHHASRRCVAPVAMASSGGDEDEHWGYSDDRALSDHVARCTSSARCGHPDYVMSDLRSAWVLIFNAGQKDEGVYTLQGRAERLSSYVLAFERTDDADRFAQLLQAEGFDLATPLCWDSAQLTAFCDAGAFEVSLVPEGALITPPTKNEYDLDAFEKVSEGVVDESAALVDPEGVDAFASQRAAFERLFNGDSTP